MATGMLNTIPKLVIITHAPLGCGSQIPTVVRSQANNKTLRGLKSTETIWINTNLTEFDVVEGGEKKLKEAILYAEKEFKPDAIAVSVSCVPALIGDDVDSIVSEAQKLVSAKVFPVHCEGFKSKLVATGYDSTYHGFLKRLVDPDDASEGDRNLTKQLNQKKTVNIFVAGSFSYGDTHELIRLIEAQSL
ncbi:MAG: nitrogenase component 1 [Chloroflexota bacterium]|nr:hypothetical protein [Chloroflexota bacterium]